VAYEKFRHIDPDAFHGRELTLHDCVSHKIVFENKALRFCLPEGFWITPHHKENTTGKTVRTDASAVSFSVEDLQEITVYVFTRNTWFLSRKQALEEWQIGQLMEVVNRGKCTIEFITQYRSYYEQMWHCVIHSEKKPYYRECQLYLPKTEATFFWNDIRLD